MDETTFRKIVEAFDEYKKSSKREPSILSTLGRTYDEDLISRLVLKCLMDDPGALARLLSVCDERGAGNQMSKEGIEVVEGKCEQVAEDLTRIDIFLKGHNALGETFTLVIENKIKSWEHSDQTKAYERWTTQSAKESEYLYFVFLKPSWNKSPHSSNAFVTITYDELPPMFTMENRFITELNEHITNHLEVDDMIDPFIIEHSKELFEIAGELERKRNAAAKEINAAILEEFKALDLVEDHSPTQGIYRFYAQNLHWWDENYKHYFYVEYKIGVEGDLSRICVQRTLKTYPKRNSTRLDAFMTKMRETDKFKSELVHHRFWIHAWDVTPEGTTFSLEWVESLKGLVLERLKVAIEETNALVKAFREKEGLI